ncbi:hypothetical protein HMPREF0731_0606, partial [Pseudoroseomonas cervicalis ATCC 49957]
RLASRRRPQAGRKLEKVFWFFFSKKNERPNPAWSPPAELPPPASGPSMRHVPGVFPK